MTNIDILFLLTCKVMLAFINNNKVEAAVCNEETGYFTQCLQVLCPSVGSGRDGEWAMEVTIY